MVFEKIREIIAEQTGKDVEEITLETNVKEDLDADSLDLFQIINDIEDEFDVSVEDIHNRRYLFTFLVLSRRFLFIGYTLYNR